ncbi:rod shape-determining protein MreC [Peribacillus butanolivorans]|jgi:rod shape-determining protein MreC|uniref:rod shape-determining protein MreC n=1 Tax=Peribacillus TaxID=2675229 RepID=UPI0006A72A89|nr:MULTISPECIES: rod shape-determining protein MreC [Peribacillus]KON70268.1 rod shape-determining protein MreC [Peribacillus butanolivorans]MBK5442783.1 rod shape-determining protein MreC [Peribacillus sp. TH24]MBK5462476.1 rod shape-determining protein MreC [Peribacillus sp. TH27]MBK5484187.1 rod shape-determining protein MreC [Peribacillus sp. TH16]MBK5500630.1 rod shape-determining protein MreC [Peribacillus sp. TH14]
MPQFFNKKLLLLLVSIIVLVALIGFSLREREELTWPEKFLKDTTGWVGNVFNKPVSGITGFVGDLKELQHTYDENKKLKARLDEYVLLKTQVQDLKEENEELRDNLGKEDDLRKYSPIQATVIGRNPERWHEMLTINKGKRNGVEKNMAVITSTGLVGKVKVATDFTASVQLLSSIDKANRVSAIIQGKDKAFGLIEGFDDEKNLLLMKRIPYDKKIKKNSLVITSGYGGIFPKGLPIGKVVDVKVDQYGLNQTAYIEPSTDFYDINNVMVVKREVGGVEDEMDGEDEVK